jgi:hypothetical protein
MLRRPLSVILATLAALLSATLIAPTAQAAQPSGLNSATNATVAAGGWSGWQNLGGKELTDTPATSSWGPGRLDLFAKGSGGTLQHMWSDNGGWYNWENLGGNLG